MGAITAALEKIDDAVLISVVTGTFQIVVELQLHSLTELRDQIRMIRSNCGIRDVLVHIYERILSSFFLGGAISGDDCQAIDAISASPGLEFLTRTVGRFDIVATVEFGTLRDFNLLVSQLRAMPSVSYCEQWLHVRIVREQYFRAMRRINHP